MPTVDWVRRSLAVFGLLVTVTVYAAEPPKESAAAPAEPTAQTGADERICRDRPRPGSRIAIRTCATAAQWAQWAALFQSPASQPQTGFGAWGQVSTVGESVGAAAFTSGGSP